MVLVYKARREKCIRRSDGDGEAQRACSWGHGSDVGAHDGFPAFGGQLHVGGITAFKYNSATLVESAETDIVLSVKWLLAHGDDDLVGARILVGRGRI